MPSPPTSQCCGWRRTAQKAEGSSKQQKDSKCGLIPTTCRTGAVPRRSANRRQCRRLRLRGPNVQADDDEQQHKPLPPGCHDMTYTYRSKAGSEQRAVRDRQKLHQGLIIQGQGLARISSRLNSLRGELDSGIAQAIWDDVPVHVVACAAGVTPAKARSLALAWEELPHSGVTAKAHVQSLSAVSQQANKLEAARGELQKQQEQLIVRALETGLLDPAQLATASGLTLEQISILARPTRHNKPLARPAPGPENLAPAGLTPNLMENLGDEKNQ